MSPMYSPLNASFSNPGNHLQLHMKYGHQYPYSNPNSPYPPSSATSNNGSVYLPPLQQQQPQQTLRYPSGTQYPPPRQPLSATSLHFNTSATTPNTTTSLNNLHSNGIVPQAQQQQQPHPAPAPSSLSTLASHLPPPLPLAMPSSATSSTFTKTSPPTYTAFPANNNTNTNSKPASNGKSSWLANVLNNDNN
ncbi:unnamed protein product [Ambrosiozyma monospora]|uniref:Unnamed protein product n=1 Tax=Ambrosiozyma monospora TaxID=43982 RepID=A0ACB5UCY4_AMBMO|nr:unnamed protein product [Ambrosiozyma monospora]